LDITLLNPDGTELLTGRPYSDGARFTMLLEIVRLV
jgi:hypothetical protein